MKKITDFDTSSMTLKEIAEATGKSIQAVHSACYRHGLDFIRRTKYEEITAQQKLLILKYAHPHNTAYFISQKSGIGYYKTRRFLLENNLPFLKTTFDIEKKGNYFNWADAKKTDFVFQ